MKKFSVFLWMMAVSIPLSAQYKPIQGWCQSGGQGVLVAFQADPTGVSDSSAAINSAVAAAWAASDILRVSCTGF